MNRWSYILVRVLQVIPTFFVFVFVMSTLSNLASLRNRCREIRERINAAPAANSPAGPVVELEGRSDFDLAADRYNAARAKFPVNVLAALCGFQEMEPLPDQPVSGRSQGP